MNISDCAGITVFSNQTASDQPVTEKNGAYTATYGDAPYTLPQDYQGKSACAPVAYGAGVRTSKR